jgi:hypothetical protein
MMAAVQLTAPPGGQFLGSVGIKFGLNRDLQTNIDGDEKAASPGRAYARFAWALFTVAR